MEAVGQLLDGMAAIAWPLVLLFLLWKFAEPIKSVIESARGRKFTIKVGNNELTMDEATEQQRRLVADLQYQVAALTQQKAPFSADFSAAPAIEAPEGTDFSILWVDDQPRNNAYEISILEDRGIDVVTATSTEEGLALFDAGHFDRVISDMGRYENGRSIGKAGLELTRKLRALGASVPIIIYCGSRAALALRDEALSVGASEITSSPTVLLRTLDLPGRSRS